MQTRPASPVLSLTFHAPVWTPPAPATWHFVTLPPEDGEVLRDLVPRRGFGSVRVRVRLGSSTWETSLFPDTKQGSYVLPLKAAVRRAEGIAVGAVVEVHVDVLDDPE